MNSKKIIIFLIGAMLMCFLAAGAVLAQEHATYTVQKGDTLWDICEKFYADAFLWPQLWAMNKHRMTNPHWVSPGDVLVLYPVETLRKKMAEAPLEELPAIPAPSKVKTPDALNSPIDTQFPDFFSFMANPDGMRGTGVNRVRVKKTVFENRWTVGPGDEARQVREKKTVDAFMEVQEVGQIVGSQETDYQSRQTAEFSHGKTLLSFFDNVIVYFDKDLTQILAPAAQDGADPYFRQFPIYSVAGEVQEPTDAKGKARLGRMLRYRGMLTVVSRIETAKMDNPKLSKTYFSKNKVMDRNPIYYIARITSASQPIKVGDRVFLFKDLD